jgi:hypothetical protein
MTSYNPVDRQVLDRVYCGLYDDMRNMMDDELRYATEFETLYEVKDALFFPLYTVVFKEIVYTVVFKEIGELYE